MKVFRIGIANDNEEINLDLPSADRLKLFDFCCRARSSDWKPLPFYVINPFKRRCEIAPFLGGLWGRSSILEDPVTYNHIHDAGEILPIKIGAEDGFILNVLTCYNALDEEASEWATNVHTGERFHLKRQCFHAHRLPRTGIFKIPETCKSQTLVVTHPNNGVEDDFYLWYHHKGYNGLVFRELWSDEERHV
jgi:hypothetical protein